MRLYIQFTQTKKVYRIYPDTSFRFPTENYYHPNSVCLMRDGSVMLGYWCRPENLECIGPEEVYVLTYFKD